MRTHLITEVELPAYKLLIEKIKEISKLPDNYSKSDYYQSLVTGVQAYGFEIGKGVIKKSLRLLYDFNFVYTPERKTADAFTAYFYDIPLGDNDFKNFKYFQVDCKEEIEKYNSDSHIERDDTVSVDLTDIDSIYPDFPEEHKSDPEVSILLESVAYHNSKNKSHHPLIAHKDQLDIPSRWENWAFSIVVLLRNSIKIRRLFIEDKPHFQLQIDLEKENYGIYNNRGKRFLNERFNRKPLETNLKLLSDSIQSFLKTTDGPEILEKRILPLRWASGGALPVAKYKKRKWVVLSFRDIAPIGWNIANGASENSSERENINKIIFREFAEEICVFSSNPYSQIDPFIVQKRFYKSDLVSQDPLKSQKYYDKQHRLRIQQDSLQIHFTDEVNDRIRVRSLETPFSLKVGGNTTEDVLFSINPYEFGAEIIRVLTFNLADRDYILDGEMHESETFLLRRPTMLLSVEFLKELYKSEKSLGNFVMDKDCYEGKRLDKIPKEDFIIFNADIAAKKKRVSQIKDSDSLEKQFYEEWLSKYESTFSKIVDENGRSFTSITAKNKWLDMLCPVTWKSIEMAIEHGILE